MKKAAEQNKYENIEDAVLIHAYAEGDEKAFETLYYRYRQQLYGYLNNLTGGSSEADEVFSETWQKVIKKAGTSMGFPQKPSSNTPPFIWYPWWIPTGWIW